MFNFDIWNFEDAVFSAYMSMNSFKCFKLKKSFTDFTCDDDFIIIIFSVLKHELELLKFRCSLNPFKYEFVDGLFINFVVFLSIYFIFKSYITFIVYYDYLISYLIVWYIFIFVFISFTEYTPYFMHLFDHTWLFSH